MQVSLCETYFSSKLLLSKGGCPLAGYVSCFKGIMLFTYR